MFDDSLLRGLFQNHFSKKIIIQMIIFVLGLLISGFGLYQLYDKNIQISSEDIDTESRVCKTNPKLGRLVVDIGGAVKNPGIYELAVGSRVNDLVDTAGGFTKQVDKYYVNKTLNLSQKINDGEKIYIPTLAESIKSIKLSSKTEINHNLLKTVSINSASKSELIKLTGIGEKRAEDIILERPYTSVYQIVEKGIITDSVFEKIKNQVSL